MRGDSKPHDGHRHTATVFCTGTALLPSRLCIFIVRLDGYAATPHRSQGRRSAVDWGSDMAGKIPDGHRPTSRAGRAPDYPSGTGSPGPAG